MGRLFTFFFFGMKKTAPVGTQHTPPYPPTPRIQHNPTNTQKKSNKNKTRITQTTGVYLHFLIPPILYSSEKLYNISDKKQWCKTHKIYPTISFYWYKSYPFPFLQKSQKPIPLFFTKFKIQKYLKFNQILLFLSSLTINSI